VTAATAASDAPGPIGAAPAGAPGAEPRRRRLRVRVLRLAAGVLVTLCDVGVATWLVGEIASDRTGWSQWASWVPTPAALALLAVAVAVLAALRTRRVLAVHAAILAFVLVRFAAVEHRLPALLSSPPATPDGSLTVLHWTLGEPAPDVTRPLLELLESREPDLVVLTDASRVARAEPIRRWLADRAAAAGLPAAVPRRLRPFTILSVRPIRGLELVAQSDGITAVRLRIDDPAAATTVSILLVDLPSDPHLARRETAQRLRRYLQEADATDAEIVIGDFNAERGAWSVRTIFPDLRHAFDDAGRGYGATFPARLPTHHIDHVLVGPSRRAVRYEIPAVGLHRHRPQVAVIAPNRP